MPGDALEHQRRDVDDEVDAEVERNIPELLSDVIVRVWPFVHPLVVHLRFLRRSCVIFVMEMIIRDVIVDDFVVVMIWHV